MNQEKALIKNASTERMFLSVAPDHLVERYFDFFESTNPDIANRKMALGTMFAAKYSELAFNQLLQHYHKTTGKHFQLFDDKETN